jgi:hypothetical protein
MMIVCFPRLIAYVTHANRATYALQNASGALIKLTTLIYTWMETAPLHMLTAANASASDIPPVIFLPLF